MATKTAITQKVAGLKIKQATYLPERAVGVATDTAELVYYFCKRLRTVATFGVNDFRFARNVAELISWPPDREDYTPGYGVILLGENAPGDSAMRLVEWDGNASGETDFDQGVFKPLYCNDGAPFTDNGRFLTRHLLTTEPGIIPADNDTVISFSKPLAHKGRRLDTSYLVERADFNAAPSSPVLGQAYILPATLPVEGEFGGGWSAFQPGDVVWWAGTEWCGETPRDGVSAFNKRKRAVYRFSVARGNKWHFEHAAPTSRWQMPNDNSVPSIDTYYRLVAPIGGGDLNGLRDLPPGAIATLYAAPDGGDNVTLRNGADVTGMENVVPFAIGQDYTLMAGSEQSVLLERDPDTNVIRILNGTPGFSVSALDEDELCRFVTRMDEVTPIRPALDPIIDPTILTGMSQTDAQLEILTIGEAGDFRDTADQDGCFKITNIDPELFDGQVLTIRVTIPNGCTREFTYKLSVGPVVPPDAGPPTGSVAMIFPSGTPQAPDTLLDVDITSIVDDVTTDENLTIEYQWGTVLQNGTFTPKSNANATNKQYDPRANGATGAVIENYTVRVTVTDEAGNAATFQPSRSAAPKREFNFTTGVFDLYDYDENPFF